MSALTLGCAWLAAMAHHQARKAINDYLSEVSARTQRARVATQDFGFEDFSEAQGADLWARAAWTAFEVVKPADFSNREAYVHAVLEAIGNAGGEGESAGPQKLKQEVLEQIPVLAMIPPALVLKLALERVRAASEASPLPEVLEVRHFQDGEWRGLLESTEVNDVVNAIERRGTALAGLAVTRELTPTAQRFIIRITWA